MRPAVALLAATACLAPGPLVAQRPSPHRIRAVRTDTTLATDGVLDEPVWAAAEPGSGFLQREPDEFEPATEKTEFRVVYTASTIYVGVHCFDSEPGALVAKEMERDASLYRDDSVAIVLDTFGDGRNAYAFETNLNGARFDALITDEGRDINTEWDGVWSVSSRRTADGWVAELAIPFSTLRYDPSIESWGINVRRMIRRKNEEVNWTPLGRDLGSYRELDQYALYRISQAGVLEGMHDIKPSRQIDVKPFVVAQATQSPGTGDDHTRDDTDLGLDLKWGVTRNLVLDMTYNTDFAEVEADQQQVNLTRFSLFFPEKREFFLENAGIFEFGPPQGDTTQPPLMKVFFSRRVGLDDGREVPIDYGVRLTGRMGQWNVGVMEVMSEARSFDDGTAVPEGGHGVLRLKRNLGQRSGIGLIYTDRDVDGGDGNQVVGLDFDYKPTPAIDVSGFWSQARDDGVEGDDWTAGGSFRYRRYDLDASLDLMRVGEGYEPAMGFLLRRDFERVAPKVFYRPRIDRKGIRNLFFAAEMDYFARESTGELESRKVSLTFLGGGTRRDDGFGLSRDRETEKLFAPFEIQPGIVIPPGLYSFDSYRLGGRTNERRLVSFRGRVSTGDFFDGTRDWANITMRVRAHKHLRAETSIDYNDVTLPAGSFTTRIIGQRFDIPFTPDLRINAFLQYNSAAELVGANVRFNWIYKPGADLFLVYNENWDAPTFNARETRDRQLILKFTYLFQG